MNNPDSTRRSQAKGGRSQAGGHWYVPPPMARLHPHIPNRSLSPAGSQRQPQGDHEGLPMSRGLFLSLGQALARRYQQHLRLGRRVSSSQSTKQTRNAAARVHRSLYFTLGRENYQVTGQK